MKSIFWTEDIASALQEVTRIKRWVRPALAGGLIGIIAIWFL